jgi:hypothetical protein
MTDFKIRRVLSGYQPKDLYSHMFKWTRSTDELVPQLYPGRRT